VAAIRRKAPKFYYNAIIRTLYRQSHDGILLCCLSYKEAKKILREADDGMCGAHQPGSKLGEQLRRLKYYWPKMIPDAIAYAKQCHACQIHGDFIHQVAGHFSPYNFFLANRNMWYGCNWTYQPTFIQRTSVYLIHN